MKVTAIIDDKIIEDAMKYSNSSTITDALKVALKEYINIQKLKELGQIIKADPMVFSHSAEDIRSINREL
ncbi:MAG: type II toxin-antitoxin system VapB family antitoxin [Pyrinomonadaceae bacterium]|nr:type II toxin-antitoxin system VapB family antitoxin [Sphingobacteriaceae bacterium]